MGRVIKSYLHLHANMTWRKTFDTIIKNNLWVNVRIGKFAPFICVIVQMYMGRRNNFWYL